MIGELPVASSSLSQALQSRAGHALLSLEAHVLESQPASCWGVRIRR